MNVDLNFICVYVFWFWFTQILWSNEEQSGRKERMGRKGNWIQASVSCSWQLQQFMTTFSLRFFLVLHILLLLLLLLLSVSQFFLSSPHPSSLWTSSHHWLFQGHPLHHQGKRLASLWCVRDRKGISVSEQLRKETITVSDRSQEPSLWVTWAIYRGWMRERQEMLEGWKERDVFVA